MKKIKDVFPPQINKAGERVISYTWKGGKDRIWSKFGKNGYVDVTHFGLSPDDITRVKGSINPPAHVAATKGLDREEIINWLKKNKKGLGIGAGVGVVGGALAASGNNND